MPIPVAIQVSIALEDGSGLADTKTAIEQYIHDYLDEIAFQAVPRSYYRIGDRIFNAPGVQDIASYTINGGVASIPAAVGEFFRLQEVTVYETQ